MKELSTGWAEFKATDRILIFESVVYGFAFCQGVFILLFLIQRRNHWKHTIYLCLAVAEVGILCFLTGRLSIAFITIKFQPDTLSDTEYGLLVWAIVGMLFAKFGYVLAAVARTRALSTGAQPAKVKAMAALVYFVCAAEIAAGTAISVFFIPPMQVQNRMYHGEATFSDLLPLLPNMLISLAVEPGINTLLTVIVNMSFLYTMFTKLNVPYDQAVKALAQQGDAFFIVAGMALAILDCATSSNVVTVTFQTQIIIFLRISFETSKSIITSHENTIVSNVNRSTTQQRSATMEKRNASGSGDSRTIASRKLNSVDDQV